MFRRRWVIRSLLSLVLLVVLVGAAGVVGYRAGIVTGINQALALEDVEGEVFQAPFPFYRGHQFRYGISPFFGFGFCFSVLFGLLFFGLILSAFKMLVFGFGGFRGRGRWRSRHSHPRWRYDDEDENGDGYVV